MSILAFAASNSRNSINKQLVSHAADVLRNEVTPGAQIDIIDLNDFEMPIYSIDREEADGIPEAAVRFKELIGTADALLISFAEHNGSYTVAFKNIFDWASRLEGKVWSGRSMVLLATSPGGRGAQTVLQTVAGSVPHHDGTVLAQLSVPSFFQNFDSESGTLTRSRSGSAVARNAPPACGLTRPVIGSAQRTKRRNEQCAAACR